MARIEQSMERLAMRPIDLGLLGAPFGALPKHSADKSTTGRTSILAPTAKGTVAERGNPLKSLLKQSSRSHNSSGHLFGASLH